MNTIGSSASSPAGIGETVETDVWSVTCRDAQRGAGILDLYPADDRRVRALAEVVPRVVPTWVAIRVVVRNVNARERYLPPTAFVPVTGDGAPVLDFLTLTPPDPDVAGTYAAGESREGWVMFQPPDEAELGDLFRFLPFQTDDDPRYFTLGDGAAPSTSEEPPPDVGPLDEGATVRTTEDVNLREGPSTDDEIVTTLTAGTELRVTGAGEEGGDFTWYPVENPETGQTGYVAGSYLEPVEE